MTNLEALRARVGYPLSDDSLQVALSGRSLNPDTLFVATGSSFDLAYADALVTVITSPNISEGGFSISMADKKQLADIANLIYTNNGVASVVPKTLPTATFVQRW